MDKLTRDNFGELLTPVHSEIFFNAHAELPKQYPMICHEEQMDRKEITEVHEGAFGEWAENQEGNAFNQDSMSEGPTATYTAERFDKSYDVTWELVQDDQYNIFNGIGKGGSATALARGLNTTVEKKVASVYNNGFANVGYDGVALFSNSHPLVDSDDTNDNLVTGALADTTLKDAITRMKRQLDEAGNYINLIAKQLIVPPELEFTSRTLVESMNVAGTANNDKNTLPNLEVVCNNYLTSTTAWFLRDNTVKTVKLKWREAPIFDSEKIAGTMDHRMFGYTRFSYGYSDYRGLVGSAGA